MAYFFQSGVLFSRECEYIIPNAKDKYDNTVKDTITDGSTATHSKAIVGGLDWILLRKLVPLEHREKDRKIER